MAKIIFSDDETYGEISSKDFQEIAELICSKNEFVNNVELRHIGETTEDTIVSKRIYKYKAGSDNHE